MGAAGAAKAMGSEWVDSCLLKEWRPRTTTCFRGVIDTSLSLVAAAMNISLSGKYERNLKTLRETDPTIEAIIAEATHTCVYRFEEKTWVRHGVEVTSMPSTLMRLSSSSQYIRRTYTSAYHL